MNELAPNGRHVVVEDDADDSDAGVPLPNGRRPQLPRGFRTDAELLEEFGADASDDSDAVPDPQTARRPRPLADERMRLRSGRTVDRSRVPLASRRVGRQHQVRQPRSLGWWRRGQRRGPADRPRERARQHARRAFERDWNVLFNGEEADRREFEREWEAFNRREEARRTIAEQDAARVEAANRREEARQERLDRAEANGWDADDRDALVEEESDVEVFEDTADLDDDDEGARRLVPALPDPDGFCQPTEELRLGTCAICQEDDAPRSVVFQACGHVSTCVKCTFELVKRAHGVYLPDGLAKCPVCRTTSVPMQLRVA